MDILNQFIEMNLIDKTDQIIPKELSLILENSFLRSRLLRTPQKIASAALIYDDFSEPINKVNIPLFIIWGEKDAIAPLRTGKMLAYNIPNSRLNVMPGLGHNPMIEKPDEFNDLVIKCLSAEPPKIQEKKQSSDKKNIILNRKQDLIIKGDYNTIELNNCRNIQIIDVNVNNIKITNSWVEIENILIESGHTAFNALDSIVTITGGSITANTGLSISNSKIDLAGVRITAKKAAVFTNSGINSTIVFSTCKIKSQFNNRYFHDILQITKDNPL